APFPRQFQNPVSVPADCSLRRRNTTWCEATSPCGEMSRGEGRVSSAKMAAGPGWNEIPIPKFQTPEKSQTLKSQTPTPKHQKPCSKHQRNPKLQIPILPAPSLPWSLAFGTFLVFGAWFLVFSSWCLELLFALASAPGSIKPARATNDRYDSIS